jgi:exodeoxyribonuclease V alpha subunit
MQPITSQASIGLEKLSGIVKRIIFHSLETGYTMLKINSSI